MNQIPLRFVPVVFVLLWSTGFIGARYAMPHAEPFTVLAIRMAVATLLLWLLALKFRVPWPDRPQAMHAMFVGLLVHGAYLGGVFSAIRNGMPAATAALIVGLQPLVTAIIARFWLGERLLRQQVLGLLIGLCGVALVLWPDQSGTLASGFGPGAVLATVVALFAISLGTLWQKRYCTGISLLAGAFWQYVATAIVLSLAALLFETRQITWNGELIFALFWLVFVLSIAAILLLMLMIRHGQAAVVASYFYLTPAATAVEAWFLFGERPGTLAFAGIAVVCFGVYLARARQ
ncbi:DMT family transporter [Granulosicoccaceae sp. 1_MG-2023]|nr:DMT family transporter [Granulosicoccaceae sp. 1_MG-2023]